MINTLLLTHLIISMLLVIIILIQQTSADGLSSIGVSGNNIGFINSRSASSLLTKTTTVLALLFFANALVLANLSTKEHNNLVEKMKLSDDAQNVPIEKEIGKTELPIAK